MTATLRLVAVLAILTLAGGAFTWTFALGVAKAQAECQLRAQELSGQFRDALTRTEAARLRAQTTRDATYQTLRETALETAASNPACLPADRVRRLDLIR
jgi:hypothetical protein